MFIILMTGLSGAGKSTLANAVAKRFTEMQIPVEIIDGDVYRKTINKDLGFSIADRKENIYRLTNVANEIVQQGTIAIIAAINPFEEQRNELSKKYKAKIIWIKCDINKLIERDTKGLYYKALLPNDHPDKIWNLTGVNDIYENPTAADLIVDTTTTSVEDSVNQLTQYIISLRQSN